jgi:hypothetical protein
MCSAPACGGLRLCRAHDDWRNRDKIAADTRFHPYTLLQRDVTAGIHVPRSRDRASPDDYECDFRGGRRDYGGNPANQDCPDLVVGDMRFDWNRGDD